MKWDHLALNSHSSSYFQTGIRLIIKQPQQYVHESKVEIGRRPKSKKNEASLSSSFNAIFNIQTNTMLIIQYFKSSLMEHTIVMTVLFDVHCMDNEHATWVEIAQSAKNKQKGSIQIKLNKHLHMPQLAS
jgi:hypothetical protein